MRDLAERNPLAQAIRKNEDGLSMRFDPKHLEPLFYHDCPQGTLDYALANLSAQPLKPQSTPVENLANASDVARAYIHCDEDRAILPGFQRKLAETIPEGAQYHLQSSHSPFFSMPAELAKLLSQIA